MSEMNEPYSISKEDWSLHRKGYEDQKRHLEKVHEAIRNNLSDLVTEESIILSDGQDIVRIPIRSLDIYKIRYSDDKNKYIGQGDGSSKIGDSIDSTPSGSRKKRGNSPGAGNQPGEDYLEANVSLMEIEEEFFADLELPRLERKERSKELIPHYDFNDIRRSGLTGNIDKKRTLLSAFKRNAMMGKKSFHPILREDLRYKTWNDTVKQESNAVVIAMIDMSGSMGTWEKYMSRSFFFWMTRFLRKKYQQVTVEFIAHHTQAKLVTEEEFFSRGESGGTICSSVYKKALEIIHEKYPLDQFNIFAFHFSDGDNLSSDNPHCVKLIEQLLDYTNLFGYGEVNQYSRNSTLMTAYKNITRPNFKYYVLKQKSDVFYAMKHFFKKQEGTS